MIHTRCASPLLLLLLLAFTALAGCAGPGGWSYSPQSDVIAEEPAAARVAVLPFQDLRGQVDRDNSLAFLIPGAPFGHTAQDRPEIGSGYVQHSAYDSAPAEDLARALAAELEASNLFRDVSTPDEAEFFGSERFQTDLYFTGTIERMSYSGGVVSYFASVVGPVLWIFGAPSSFTRNDLALRLELRRAENGEILWSGTPFRGEAGRVNGLYYGTSNEFGGFPALMARACRGWIDEIRVHTAKSPGSLTQLGR